MLVNLKPHATRPEMATVIEGLQKRATAVEGIALYLQPVHAGGPIAADPPQPIRVVTTDAQGHFRFAGLHPGKRYFVFAVGAHGMTVGHWTTPGHSVKLVACRTCAMPL